MDSLVGILYRDWKQLLRQNEYQVSRSYLLKAAIITLLSLRNTY
jgi:hypothetical protein